MIGEALHVEVIMSMNASYISFIYRCYAKIIYKWEITTWLSDLTLSWRRLSSYRNQSTELRSESVDWFLNEYGLRHERVKLLDNIIFIDNVEIETWFLQSVKNFFSAKAFINMGRALISRVQQCLMDGLAEPKFVKQSTTKVITIAHCRERKREKKRERATRISWIIFPHIYFTCRLWEVNDITLSGLVYF